MEIDSNSWHARVYQKYGKSNQPTLCQYFWRVILGAPLEWAFNPDRSSRPFASLALLLIASSTLMSIASGDPWWYGTVILLIIITGAVVFTGIGIGACHLADKLITRKDRQSSQPLTRSYISAKKNKVCPYIEFTEES